MSQRVAVFGLGYVGCVSAACLAERGNNIVGVDVNPDKVSMINGGQTTVVEERIGELVAEQVSSGRLRATTDYREAIDQTDVALVCVGTPSRPSGGLSTDHLARVASQIGSAIAKRDDHYTVVIRSTMLPGTCDDIIRPRLEDASSLRAGVDFGLAVNPEFLREGSSVRDFYDPPKTVIGELTSKDGDAVSTLYEGLPGPTFRVPIKVAEMVKYTDNSFHALKIGFANEIGRLCKSLELDSHEVMSIFTSDRKLNISPAYLTPGYAFGGSCLPKDVRALVYAARHADVSVPILESLVPSNERQIAEAFEIISRIGSRRIGMFGLSFKKGTDDLRESPLVALAELLVGRGFDLLIYDADVSVSALMGANLAYVEERIPHLRKLMASTPEAVAAHAEVCVVGSYDSDVLRALKSAPHLTLVDLVRYPGSEQRVGDQKYIGLCW